MGDHETKTVAFRTQVAEDRFRKLIAQLETDSGASSVFIEAATDALERFKLWAGNIGARRSAASTASLESRLETAKRILEQVEDLLDDLILALDDLLDIVSGSRENRQIIYENPIKDNDSSSLEYQLGVEADPGLQGDEFQDVLGVVSDCVRSLLKISFLIRKATSRDRFARALQSGDPFIDQFDINYVVERYPKLGRPGSGWLCTRLGRAITKRRQFLRYSREHGNRLAGPDGNDGERGKTQVLAKDKGKEKAVDMRLNTQLGSLVGRKLGDSVAVYTHASTKASTLDIMTLQELREDEANKEDARSFISAGSSVLVEHEGLRLHLPSLEELSRGQPIFECPLCFCLQKFTQESAWRRHVYGDLKAYVCTLGEGKCDSAMFGDSRAWFDHEIQCHRKQWMCVVCSEGPFRTPTEFKSHMKDMHTNVPVNDNQLEIFMSAGQRAVDVIPADECPFCDEWGTMLKSNTPAPYFMDPSDIRVTVEPVQFRHHVASHMEQLALFAIPRNINNNELEEDSSKAAALSRSTVQEELRSPRLGISNADETWVPDPPLHIAAASGDLATFRVLLKEGADIHARGETWETVLEAALSCQQSTRDDILNLLKSHCGDVLLPDIPPSTDTRDGQPSPRSQMSSSVDESMAMDDQEITREALVLRYNGSIITYPPMFAGVPLEKVSENHPFWNPEWEPLEKVVEAALNKWKEKLENLRHRPDVVRHTMFLANRQVNRGNTVLDFLKHGCFHPLQFANRETMDKYYKTFINYDTVFRLVSIHEELKKFDLEVMPLEWLRQRLYEIATAQGDRFNLSKTTHDLYHDSKLKALREKHKFGDAGRGYQTGTKRKDNDPLGQTQIRLEPDEYLIQRRDEIGRLKAIERLWPCHEFLFGMRLKKGNVAKQSYAIIPKIPGWGGNSSPIKIAIIDSGVDMQATTIQREIPGMIERGISYVNNSVGLAFPWWTDSDPHPDPHGTLMASLVAAANPWCRLYIARVDRNQWGINPEDAAKAVDWAIEQNVDIISISLVTKTQSPTLKQAIDRAVNRALIFCPTTDQGAWSEQMFPADYEGTVRVSATDYHESPMLTPNNEDRVAYISVPVEYIPAVPPYPSKSTGIASGSAVATALAAGIASLSLLMLLEFNDTNKDALREKGIYQNNKIAELLSMAINPAETSQSLFPTDSEINELPNRWSLDSIMSKIDELCSGP